MKCVSSSKDGGVRVWDCLDTLVIHKQYQAGGEIKQMIYLEQFSQLISIEDDNIVVAYDLQITDNNINIVEEKEIDLGSNLISIAKSTGSLVIASDDSGYLTSNNFFFGLKHI